MPIFNKIKKYKILFIKNDGLSFKELNFLSIVLSGCLIITLFLLIVFISLYSTDLNKIISFYEIRRHSNNNEFLQNKIDKQESRIDNLLEEIDRIKNRDENLRQLLKMPSIDNGVRKLGIGGLDSLSSLNDLNYLLPNKINLNGIPKDLNFVERSINLENLSYNEIEEAAESNLDYYLHYPAIHPVSLDDGRRTSRYGYRVDPFSNKRKFHEGDDFSSKIGVTVIATANGVVKSSRKYGSFGNYIEIDHGNGYVTVYGHLSKRNVKKGEKVVRGEKIGEVGNTGRSTAPHLHYEVLLNNKHTNPSKYYYVIKS